MEQHNPSDDQHLIDTYFQHADVAIESAELNLEHGFYTTAINRAYYAIFYAASGLRLTRGISRRPLTAQKALSDARRFVERARRYPTDTKGG